MSCNKIAFESKKEAKRYYKDKIYKGCGAKQINIYICPACSQYHFTSASKAKARRIKRNIRRGKVR
jgi:hypothetical protein